MTDLLTLWLPIIASAIAVFFWASLSWMALPLHKEDIKFLGREQEDALAAVIREKNIPPDNYMFPMCSDPKDYKSEEFQKRFKSGPWGSIRIQPGPPVFARNLSITAAFYFLVSILVAYITGEARAPGAGFLPVFQIATTAAFMAYALGTIPGGVFFAKKASAWISETIDAIVQSVITGLIFALLWPAAALATG
ncbi:MAG: hypothetical protein ACTS3F_02260 [Phycisphaerales bacterium]